MKENKFRTNETAQQIAQIITAETEFCRLYNISDANMNVNVEDKSNRVTLISEDVQTAKEIVTSMNLQSDFMSAVSRITVWLDSNAIVVFIGAVFAVHATLAEKTEEQKATFESLFTESRDVKYNERKLKKVTITAQTETRHTFDSIDKFQSFFSLLAQFVVARKSALSADSTAQQTETAKETAQQTETKEKKAQQKKRQQKQKKDSKKDFSDVSAEVLADITKEIIESETNKA